MAKTNTLTSHYGESISSRADKMSGMGKEVHRSYYRTSSLKYLKHFMNRKRRMFLKNKYNWDKI